MRLCSRYRHLATVCLWMDSRLSSEDSFLLCLPLPLPWRLPIELEYEVFELSKPALVKDKQTNRVSRYCMNTVVALCAPEGVPGSVFTSRADPPSMPEPGLWGNPQATHPSCCTSRAPDMSAGPFGAPSMVHSRLYGTPMSFDRSCTATEGH